MRYIKYVQVFRARNGFILINCLQLIKVLLQFVTIFYFFIKLVFTKYVY